MFCSSIKMKTGESILMSLCLCCIHWTVLVQGSYLKECGKPSDVVFLLDSSGSIYKYEYEHQLAWVNSVIDEFDIGIDKMRVGVISFSNWAFLEFYLNSYNTKYPMQDAVYRIPHSRGDTNTAAAITFLKDNMFQVHNGGRPGVPRVAIVLTDGESNDPMQTAYQAEAARRMGIQIFAIGIGHKVNEAELKNIASYPPSQYKFHVANYEALKSIKDTVAINACEVTTPKPISTTPALPDDSTCGESVMADVVLAVSPRGSDVNTEKSLSFFREVARGLDVGKDKIHVGLVPKDCRDIPEINLKTFSRKQDALNTLDKLTSQEQADTTDVLRYMRKTSFNKRLGSRHRAKKIAVLIVDGSSDNMSAARKEAERLQVKKGIELCIVAVGKHVKTSKLRKMVTEPVETHLFHVTNYDDLHSIIPAVQQAICPVPLLL